MNVIPGDAYSNLQALKG